MVEIVMYTVIFLLLVAATALRLAGRAAVRKALQQEQKENAEPHDGPSAQS